MIEDFAKEISKKEDIWYATNIEIYDYTKAFEQLLFNTEMTMVYNPSAFEINFIYDGKNISIKSGETKSF